MEMRAFGPAECWRRAVRASGAAWRWLGQGRVAEYPSAYSEQKARCSALFVVGFTGNRVRTYVFRQRGRLDKLGCGDAGWQYWLGRWWRADDNHDAGHYLLARVAHLVVGNAFKRPNGSHGRISILVLLT
jgi:hypothetical protein